MTTRQVINELQDIAAAKQEHMFCITLDVNEEMIAKHLIFKGTLTSMVVHPREVFACALEDRAAAIIVVHNHPSGDPTPSTQDIETTKQFFNAGRIMAIRMHDHIIISKDRHYSFAANGMMELIESEVISVESYTAQQPV